MPKGFTLPCPYCEERESSLSVNCWAIDKENAFFCHDCETEFSVAEVEETVEEMVRKWRAVITWVKAAPEL